MNLAPDSLPGPSKPRRPYEISGFDPVPYFDPDEFEGGDSLAWHPDEFERRYGMPPMTAGYRWRWALIGLIAYLLSMLFAATAFC